jgi:acetyltransferase-like isoleucine patch superfamily enzyme
MTVWDCPIGPVLGRVSAGAPMGGSKTVLADLREPKPAASLEPAEITFGGPFIARGYLGRPDLTEKAFVSDFTAGAAQKDAKIYMTGDLGRWREGEIELLGRKDFQVKLRGFRIELGEIESAIRATGSRAAVCVIRKGAGGADALVAYYEDGTSGPISEAVVRASCKKMLPPYMQPQALVAMEKLPRNANGKVDRPKLPAPVISAAADTPSAAAVTLPETALELAIAEAWASVLGLKDPKKVPVDVDFQELGGTSLLAGRATAFIRKRLRLPGLAGTVMYQHPTIQRLSTVVEGQLAERDAQEAAEALEESCTTLAPACQPPVETCSNSSPLALMIQSVGILVLNFIFESHAWSPFWWEAWFVYAGYGRAALMMFLPFAFVGDAMMQVAIVIILKWLIVGRVKEGTHPMWSVKFFRWWFVEAIMKHTTKQIIPLVADTPLASAYYRLLGADIGRNVRIGVGEIPEPDLVKIGDNVTIGKRVQLRGGGVMRGALHLGNISIGDDAAVGHCAVLPQGCHVPEGKAVVPLSTAPGWNGNVGSVAMTDAKKQTESQIRFQRNQDLLRCVFGLPYILVLNILNFIPLIFVLEWFWDVCSDEFGDNAFNVFSVLLAWVYVHPLWMGFLAVVILQKWLIVGRIDPTTPKTHWRELRYWIHARTVESHNFVEVCEMWVNTEILSSIYRALGVRIGKRVQIDAFHAVEHDLIEVADYTVFGSEVLVSCDSSLPWILNGDGFEPVRMEKASNILDHCVLCPGTVVGEKAVLGTCTLANHRTYVPPLAVHSGSVRGSSMFLRKHNPTPQLKNIEEEAMRRLDDPVVWYRFNIVLFLITVLVKPIPEALWIITYFIVTAAWDPETGGIATLLTIVPIVYMFVSLIELLLVISVKWLVIGRYKEGDFPFFSVYHVKWMAMMILKGGISSLSDALEGTYYNTWVFRAFGAKVGKNCYLAGLAVEYDLLEVGDNVAIGTGCDTTGHTVENMVIKLSATKIASGASMLPASFAMPGCSVGENSVLLEHTQVLKGETVPADEVWAGMPAARARCKAPE